MKYITYCPNCGTMRLMEMEEITHCDSCQTMLHRTKELDENGSFAGYHVLGIHSDRQLFIAVKQVDE